MPDPTTGSRRPSGRWKPSPPGKATVLTASRYRVAGDDGAGAICKGTQGRVGLADETRTRRDVGPRHPLVRRYMDRSKTEIVSSGKEGVTVVPRIESQMAVEYSRGLENEAPRDSSVRGTV